MDILIAKSLSDYESWVESNSPEKFTLFDYIHGILSTKDIELDIVFAILKFFWPEFCNVNGLVFLQEEYSESKYRELIQQGYSGKDLEYWMNLTSIDGLFDKATFEQSKYLGRQITSIWESKLEKDFPDKLFKVDCIIDGDEVFTAFYQQN